MRITQEADYALRMISLLADGSEPIGAPQLAAAVCVPPSFTVKILRKLTAQGIVKARRGVTGGYSLCCDASSLSIKRVIEAIDGPIEMQKCLNKDHMCSRNADKSRCRFHMVFEALNNEISQKLDAISIEDMINSDISSEQLIEKLK